MSQSPPPLSPCLMSVLMANTHTHSLLTQPSLEATPLQEDDDTVENIGVAYLEPGRNPRLPERGDANNVYNRLMLMYCNPCVSISFL